MHFLVIFCVVFGNQMRLSMSSDSTTLHLCMNNKSLVIQVLMNPFNDMSCKCQAGPTTNPSVREDYIHTPGIGSHKLHTEARTWNEARKICNQEDAHLAIINSKAEESVLVNVLKSSQNLIKNGTNTEQAYLGIHNFFENNDWVTVFGESLYATGYSGWSQTYWNVVQPDNKNGNQHCAALINNGGMDDVFCFENYAFFCELPLNCKD